MREAIALGHAYIGTEHILLGPAPRGRRGSSVRVLNGLGADPNRVRQQVIQLVSARRVQEEPGTGRAAGRGKRKLLSELRGRQDALDWRLSVLEPFDDTRTAPLPRPSPARPGDHPGPPRQGKRHRRPGLRERGRARDREQPTDRRQAPASRSGQPSPSLSDEISDSVIFFQSARHQPAGRRGIAEGQRPADLANAITPHRRRSKC